jgi:protein disulfide-isomerase A6
VISEAENLMEKYGIGNEIDQLVSEDMLASKCKEGNRVCIVAFLPHIFDNSSEERNGYIAQLKDASKASKGKPITLLWVQGGDFYPLEEKLNLAFGYPAVIAINFAKKKYSIQRLSFSADNIKTFVGSCSLI